MSKEQEEQAARIREAMKSLTQQDRESLISRAEGMAFVRDSIAAEQRQEK